MEIKLYGTGCHKCRQLFENVKTALDAAGIEAEIRKITDLAEITNAGILLTPALEIDGKIVASGKVLSASEILALLPAQNSCCACRACGQHAKTTPQKACSRKSPWKKLLAYLLIAVAMTALAIVMIRENGTAPNTAVSEQNSEKLIVYYFHGNVRCKTCNAFERLTEETLNKEFSQEIASGKMVLKVVNVEQKENEHFVTDFGLTTKSVVLARSGHFQNLDQIWLRIRQGNEAFQAYISESIRHFQQER